MLAALNGVLGDYLEASGNPLAIRMSLRRKGSALQLDKNALAAAIPNAGGRLLILAHGLCMNDLQWKRQGHDHGAALARDLGYTPVYLHYNSGRHISTNGREFSGLLDALLSAWPAPVDELTIIGHSMGGLLARSAWHYGMAEGRAWPLKLKGLVFLGTPHHGAPMERGGNWIDIALGLSPTPRRCHGWARSAAPASRTCATATCSTRTGAAATVLRGHPAITKRCRCLKTCSASHLPPPRASRRAISGQTDRRRTGAVGKRAGLACETQPQPGIPRKPTVDRLRDWPPRPARSTRSVCASERVAGWQRLADVPVVSVPDAGRLPASAPRSVLPAVSPVSHRRSG
ncbi:MAG: GPI inositol-deacylase [Rhodocyclaceae bacterium]|nr:GPI inositol-deacylase [Rhodocyclaceae bacterium]